MLTTGVASGVVSSLGTPYGSIVYSIELCSSVYLLSNLYKAFVCGSIGNLLYKYFHSFK
jgi:H+/Cl- antiporter ClcA